MVAFFVPPPPFRTSSASGYSFTMTAAMSGFVTGYVAGSAGSISAEPILGQTLLELWSLSGLAVIAFDGDVTGLLSGLTVYVDGVSYAAGFSGWEYDEGGDATYGTWASGGPDFVDAGVYAAEIK